jgi:hypothetical protein
LPPITTKEIETLFRITAEIAQSSSSGSTLAGVLTFSGAQLVATLRETHRRARPSECLFVAQHMLDTASIAESTAAAAAAMPSLVFSENRVYSSALFRELADHQARGLLGALREHLARERKTPAGKVTSFAGSQAVGCWATAASISRQQAVYLGQELLNKGYVVSAT